MKYYVVDAVLQYDSLMVSAVVRASSKQNASMVGKVIVATQYHEPDPSVSVRQIDVLGVGRYIYKCVIYTTDHQVVKYIMADSYNDVYNTVFIDSCRGGVDCNISVSKVDVYNEDILESKPCEHIDQVVVFWLNEGKLEREVFADIDVFDTYATSRGLHYNCESTEVLCDNVLKGIIFNKWRMIDGSDLQHKVFVY